MKHVTLPKSLCNFYAEHKSAVILVDTCSYLPSVIMYAIVEWIGSDPPQVSAVPSNWIVTDKFGKLQSYWPSSSSDVLAFKQRWEPRSSWKKYDVRQIGLAGNCKENFFFTAFATESYFHLKKYSMCNFALI
jgi:hypothetical protein